MEGLRSRYDHKNISNNNTLTPKENTKEPTDYNTKIADSKLQIEGEKN